MPVISIVNIIDKFFVQDLTTIAIILDEKTIKSKRNVFRYIISQKRFTELD